MDNKSERRATINDVYNMFYTGFPVLLALGFPSLTYNTSCHGRNVIASDNTKNHFKDSKMDRRWHVYIR